MKQPVILKTILDICFFFLIFSFLSALFATITTIFFGDGIIPININDTVVTEFTPTAITFICLKIIVAGLVLYTIFLLRHLIRNFLKGKLFTRYQIKTLRKIGQFIIIITITEGVLAPLANLVLRKKARLEIGIDISFGSFWFILALGLFFLYLSKIFSNARIMKKENELTV